MIRVKAADVGAGRGGNGFAEIGRGAGGEGKHTDLGDLLIDDRMITIVGSQHIE